MLAYLGAKCVSHIACYIEKEKPVKNKTTIPDMVKRLYRDNEEERTISDLHELFTEHDRVLCFNNHKELQNDIQYHHEVLNLLLISLLKIIYWR